MTLFRHIHVFLKFGITVEHNDVAQTILFDVLDFIIALATFDRWAGRYVRLRYYILSRYYSLRAYLGSWCDDLRLMQQALRWQPCTPVWGYG